MRLATIVVGDDGSAAARAALEWAEAFSAITAGDVVPVTIDERRDGSASAGVIERARRSRAELIVVGRRGRGGFPDLQLGATAHQIAEHASVPVAVVPNVEAAPETTRSFARLAVGVDGSAAAGLAAGWAASFAATASARVWAVHAVGFVPSVPTSGPEPAASRDAGVSEVMERQWCAPLRDAGVDHEPVLLHGGPAAVLLDAVRAHRIDLLVVGRRDAAEVGPLAMGGVAQRAIAFSPCPTVVVPAPERRIGPANAR